ncbi:DUF2283 domain-containing protein [Candidatus Woesearchaeota archaeon]|nr:DUF2283 domain-containing protein [Candidatus Woesearchaeota archaeon]
MKNESVFLANYDDKEDVLHIYHKKAKVKESIEVSEDIIFDVDKNEKIVGIEIFYASELFQALNKEINKEILGILKEIKVSIDRYRDYIIILVGFEVKGKMIKEKLPMISMKEYESPLLAQIA